MAGNIRSYWRMCGSKINPGNHCEKDQIQPDNENCYSYCRKDYCNDINGDLDPREFFDDGKRLDATANSPNLSTAEIDGPRRNDTAALGGSVTVAGMLVGLGAAAAVVHAWP